MVDDRICVPCRGQLGVDQHFEHRPKRADETQRRQQLVTTIYCGFSKLGVDKVDYIARERFELQIVADDEPLEVWRRGDCNAEPFAAKGTAKRHKWPNVAQRSYCLDGNLLHQA